MAGITSPEPRIDTRPEGPDEPMPPSPPGRRRRVLVAVAAAACALLLGLAGVLALNGDDDDTRSGTTADVTGPPVSTTEPAEPTTTVSSTPTTGPASSAAPTTALTSVPPTVTAPPSPATTAPAGTVPDAVAVIRAERGAGSGELLMLWNAASGATGYRIERAPAPGGTFATVADIDVATGRATANDEVLAIQSAGGHLYVPAGALLAEPDGSAWFQYDEFVGSGTRCFRVVAYNAAGAAAPSPVACASYP